MSWYLFSGKVLNYHSGINTIDNILSHYSSDLKQEYNETTDNDLRIFFSCSMKSLLDFFLHISYKIKSSIHTSVSKEQKLVKVDTVNVYRIAGANLHRNENHQSMQNDLPRKDSL